MCLVSRWEHMGHGKANDTVLNYPISHERENTQLRTGHHQMAKMRRYQVLQVNINKSTHLFLLELILSLLLQR